ncbi:hypothetical protein B0T24DRAFT_416768 [Lasiosphaeria ovina]|uniref:Uncharacterized protein n=1 Tax=Lasiosphaeria ovina TaxID=92902 RepID=A0AAE0JXM3_9PEZI|nr:hypothetical protein B0T24DRAFT_416768 [Lasiosphaeria ovina]
MHAAAYVGVWQAPIRLLKRATSERGFFGCCTPKLGLGDCWSNRPPRDGTRDERHKGSERRGCHASHTTSCARECAASQSVDQPARHTLRRPPIAKVVLCLVQQVQDSAGSQACSQALGHRCKACFQRRWAKEPHLERRPKHATARRRLLSSDAVSAPSLNGLRRRILDSLPASLPSVSGRCLLPLPRDLIVHPPCAEPSVAAGFCLIVRPPVPRLPRPGCGPPVTVLPSPSRPPSVTVALIVSASC